MGLFDGVKKKMNVQNFTIERRGKGNWSFKTDENDVKFFEAFLKFLGDLLKKDK